MSTTTIPTIRHQITINAPVERAFAVFTDGFHTWWPQSFHIGATQMERAVIEPRVGGRWYERGVDGSECEWGSVLAWDPPTRLVLTWQINGAWEYDPDPRHASEIEVQFRADGSDRTVMAFEHRHLDRLAHADALASAVGGEQGWHRVLAAFSAATA
jgi:uncharacterized protein YndB with AHSA1/START domain